LTQVLPASVQMLPFPVLEVWEYILAKSKFRCYQYFQIKTVKVEHLNIQLPISLQKIYKLIFQNELTFILFRLLTQYSFNVWLFIHAFFFSDHNGRPINQSRDRAPVFLLLSYLSPSMIKYIRLKSIFSFNNINRQKNFTCLLFPKSSYTNTEKIFLPYGHG